MATLSQLHVRMFEINVRYVGHSISNAILVIILNLCFNTLLKFKSVS